MAFLGFLLFKLIQHFYIATAIIMVDGQVILDKMAVHFTDDVRIVEMYVDEGQSVCKGEALFKYINGEFDDDGINILSSRDNSDWLIRERLSTLKEISFKQIQLVKTQQQMLLQKQEFERMAKMVLIDVYENADLDPLRRMVEEQEINEKSLKAEIRLLNQYLSSLNTQVEREALLIKNEGIGLQAELLTYRSPIDGIIGAINMNPNEVCYEGDDVMTVHKPDEISIYAYFDQKVVDDINRGELVTITFPDGSKTKGRIENFYVSTYALPDEFQKRYEPTERTILAEVVPLNESDKQSWKQFYKMNVKITKARYNIS